MKRIFIEINGVKYEHLKMRTSSCDSCDIREHCGSITGDICMRENGVFKKVEEGMLKNILRRIKYRMS